MKCIHELEWDTCTLCRWPCYNKPGDRVIKTRRLCDEHDLRTPEADVESCIWCWMANVKIETALGD